MNERKRIQWHTTRAVLALAVVCSVIAIGAPSRASADAGAVIASVKATVTSGHGLNENC
jgi:hypothetical protein